MPSASNSSLRDVCRIFFRQRRKIFWFFGVVFGTVTLAVIVWPRSYRSEAKLFVRLGRENMLIDPTATLGQPTVVATQLTRENELNSLVEMFRSRVVVEKVVDAFGPDTILEQLAPSAALETAAKDVSPACSQPPSDRKAVAALLEAPTAAITDRDRAIIALSKYIELDAAKKSDVITVGYETHNPRLSQAIVAKLVDCYLEEHIRLNRTPGAREFLTQQTADMRTDLERREEELRDLKNKIGLVSQEAQRQVMTARVGRIEDELLQAQSEIAAAEAQVKMLQGKAASLSETDVSARTDGISNPAAAGMLQQLYALKLREQELLSRSKPGHPEVVAIHQQVEQAEALAQKEQPTRAQITTGPSRTFEEAQLSLIRQEPVLASLKSKAAALADQLAQARNELREFNNNDLRLSELQREIDLREVSYRRYSESLQQSGIDQALELQKISNINIVQPATYDPKPVRPRALLSLLLGLLLAVLGSIGLALAAEAYDHSFNTSADVERRLQLPILATIPRVDLESLAGNGRR
jgi:polysaccharide biosynthesis protein PslE